MDSSSAALPVRDSVKAPLSGLSGAVPGTDPTPMQRFPFGPLQHYG